jgi:drug/metabolite transporter (DMT)-like permease
VGLLGVWLASRPEGAVRPTGLAWALLAGLGFGGYFVLIDRVEGLFWPSALAKLAALALTLAYALLKRPKRWPRPREWPLVTLAGVLDVAAVISSLYPASTVLLARVMLHERLHRAQALGVLLSLGAIALISAG